VDPLDGGETPEKVQYYTPCNLKLTQGFETLSIKKSFNIRSGSGLLLYLIFKWRDDGENAFLFNRIIRHYQDKSALTEARGVLSNLQFQPKHLFYYNVLTRSRQNRSMKIAEYEVNAERDCVKIINNVRNKYDTLTEQEMLLVLSNNMRSYE